VGGYGIDASSIKSSSAIDCGGYAIIGDQVSDCRGQSTGSGYGITAYGTAQNRYGSSGTMGDGVYAHGAENWYGTRGTGHGVYANGTAQNCYGYSGGGGNGVYALYAAVNCNGFSSYGVGVYTLTAQNCFGQSSSGQGIQCESAQNCYGACT